MVRFTFYGSVNTLQSSQHILEYITVADINWQENLIGFTQQIFCKKEKQLLTPDLQSSFLYLVWANNSNVLTAMLILNNLCSQLVVMKFGGELMAFILQTMRKYLKPTNYFTLVILCRYNYFQDSCRYSACPDSVCTSVYGVHFSTWDIRFRCLWLPSDFHTTFAFAVMQTHFHFF